MDNDVFQKTEVKFGGAMTADKGMFTSTSGLTGVLMQGLQLQYQQNVTRLYEIGNAGEKTNVYYVGGRAAGTFSVSHVIGPGVAMKAYYDSFSDVCNAGQNAIKFSLKPNVCGTNVNTEKAEYRAKYCVLVNVGLSVQASDFVVNQNSSMMFSGLEYNP